MLIKMSTECTRQIKFQSQPPGQFWWADSSSLWCTWACSTPLPRKPTPRTQVMLQQWCHGSLRNTSEIRFVGKVVVIDLAKDVWGRGKPYIIPHKAAVSLPTPALTFLPEHKPRRWGLLPCSPPCNWAGTSCLSHPPYSLFWHLNRTAVFEHCLPIPSPPNSLHWKLKLSLGGRTALSTAKRLPQT